MMFFFLSLTFQTGQKKWDRGNIILNNITLDTCLILREIIVYSQSTINACSLLSHELWVPLIKFMVRHTIYVR